MIIRLFLTLDAREMGTRESGQNVHFPFIRAKIATKVPRAPGRKARLTGAAWVVQGRRAPERRGAAPGGSEERSQGFWGKQDSSWAQRDVTGLERMAAEGRSFGSHTVEQGREETW